MTAPLGPRWLADRTLDGELRDEIRGEIEERWRTRRHSRLRTVWQLHRLVVSVAWHAWRERRRSLVPSSSRRSLMMPSLRLAIRRWTTRPGLAVAAVAVLAIGLGATTSIASIVDAVLFRPLPWTHPEQLIDAFVERPGWRANPVLASWADSGTISWPMLKDVQQHSRTLAAFGAWVDQRQTLNGPENEPVRTMNVSASLLPLLGVAPARGRLFAVDEDDVAGPSVMVSWDAWQRRYGGREDIVGLAIAIDEQPLRVVGVLPRGFHFGPVEPAEFLLPIGRTPLNQRTEGNHFLHGVGRLTSGSTLAQAQQELTRWMSGDEGVDRKQPRLTPLDADRRRASREALLILLGAAALLLVIATANVAALLLGDAASRRHEVAIRVALGGTRGHVSRQLFLEHLVLASVATALGLIVAAFLTPLLLSLAPSAMPFADTARLDGRLFLFAGVLAAVVALGFGVVPSLVRAGLDPSTALRDAGRDGSPHRVRGFRWVVIAQVALATVLLVGAGLLVETLRQLTSQPVGFDPERLAVTALRLPPVAGPTPEARAALRAQRTQTILDTLGAQPGVTGVAATSTAPFSGDQGTSAIQIPGKTFARNPSAHRHIVSEGYFSTLGIPIVKGRGFQTDDRFGAHAAVVTDEFERALMDGDAVGKRFVLNGDEHTIVGVIRSVKQQRYTDQPLIAMYALLRQLPQWPTNTFMIRTAGDPSPMLAGIRRAVIAAEPQASFLTLEIMDDMTRRSVAEERYRAQLMSAFGVLAMVLSTIGLYGLMARGVADRRREIGVRLALGADSRAVRRLVFRQAMGLAGAGLLVGVPAALAVSYSLRNLLFGVPAASPAILLIAAATLALAATLSALGPARRAARIDPTEALRGR